AAATDREVDRLAVAELRPFDGLQGMPVLELVRKDRVPFATIQLVDRAHDDGLERLDARLHARWPNTRSAVRGSPARARRGSGPDDAQLDRHAPAPSRNQPPVGRWRARESVALRVANEESAERERGHPRTAECPAAIANRFPSRCLARKESECRGR